MRVSQRLDYTVRILVAMAGLPTGELAPAGRLARELGLPRRFVEQQMTALAKTGLVECRRGTGGGCALAPAANAATMLDIVRAVQGHALDVPRVASSAASEMWADVATRVEESLTAVTLRDLAARQADIDAGTGDMYFI